MAKRASNSAVAEAPSSAVREATSSREPGDEGRPVWEKRMGRVTCSIWPQQDAEGRVWYSATLSRIYKDDNGWKRSYSFGKNDLPLVARLAALAMDWIYFQSQQPASAKG